MIAFLILFLHVLVSLISAGRAGRPGGRCDFQRQNRRKPVQCQRFTSASVAAGQAKVDAFISTALNSQLPIEEVPLARCCSRHAERDLRTTWRCGQPPEADHGAGRRPLSDDAAARPTTTCDAPAGDKKLAGAAKPCPCRELHPAVLMMKSAEDRPRGNVTEPLDRTNNRRILTQG
jgi:hypothetical protein